MSNNIDFYENENNIKSYETLKICITGKSGYLGSSIEAELAKRGHEVIGVGRNLIYGTNDILAHKLEGIDVVINLAGAPVLQRWTARNKKLIYDSRVITTRNLVNAIRSLPSNKKPVKFISASAIGIYKQGAKHDETSTFFDEGFLGKVVKDWEHATSELPANIQKITFRIGIVLGKKAKTISNLLLPFKLGLGATIGKGQQPFPYIHETDVVRAFVWAVEEFHNSALFNLVAPEKINNHDFTMALANALHRRAYLAIPEFVLKIVLGEAAELLTKSPEVEPKNLLLNGFKFEFPDIGSALKQIIQN